MRSKVAQRLMAKMPEETKIFASKYADLVVLINQILKEKEYTQKSLAEKLEKKPSEIHKWLNGEHNFTLRSICKLEAELGETLLEVPIKRTAHSFNSIYGKTTFKVYKNVCPKAQKSNDWKEIEISQKHLANVG